ncbi:hypothetical protein SeLEV6574_g08164 [Synchytrium endobioticum]|uniref:DUF599 domain-containing protein n=1 Tax=Synchytrium endobioticum TaxID=286115 RepID=A0A507C3S9_9FUNG|nr:hypothetical protein SeLEV6574_g08164 [Synchytrium endobioticum]
MSAILPDVPVAVCSVALYIGYHGWLIHRVSVKPLSTVIGITRLARRRWIAGITSKNDGSLGVLAVQTIRNYLIMSSMLATVAITLSVGVMAIVASLSKSTTTGEDLQFLGGWDGIFKLKVGALISAFVCAFVSFLEAMRYMNHAGFLMTTVKGSSDEQDKRQQVKTMTELASRMLNRGALFHTFGTRFLLYCFPILGWLFTAWALMGSTILLVVLFYALDQEASEDFGSVTQADVRNLEIAMKASREEDIEIQSIAASSKGDGTGRSSRPTRTTPSGLLSGDSSDALMAGVMPNGHERWQKEPNPSRPA